MICMETRDSSDEGAKGKEDAPIVTRFRGDPIDKLSLGSDQRFMLKGFK